MGDDASDIERDLRRGYLELPVLEPASHARLRQALAHGFGTRGARTTRRPRRSLPIAAAVAALGVLAGSAFGFGPIDAIRKLDPHEAAVIRNIGRTFDQDAEKRPGNVPRSPRFAPDRTSAILAHHQQIVDGVRWSFITYRNADGLTCAGVRFSGGQGLSCYPLRQMLAAHPLSATFGGRQLSSDYYHWGQVWIEGFAAPSIRKLTLRFTDCSTASVPLDRSGVLLYVVDHGRLRRLIWPTQLRAYDARGRLVATQSIHIGTPNALAPHPKRRTCRR